MCFPYLSKVSSAVTDSNFLSAFDKSSSTSSSVERDCFFRDESRARFVEADEILLEREFSAEVDAIVPCSWSLTSSWCPL